MKEGLVTTKVKLQSSKGILILGDLHVDYSNLRECEEIANEIAFSNKADILIQVGDICDKNKLASHELDALTSMIKKWQTVFKEVHILEGNHDKLDKNYSIIMYLKHLGVHIHDDDVVFETPYGNLRCGHYFIDKSVSSFGHFRMTLEEFRKDCDYGLLGHQHDFQLFEDNFCHIGSSRYVSFGERKIQSKVYAVLNNNGLEYSNVTSCIPMFDISSLQELERLPKKSKVRYIFKSFEQLKNELEIVNTKKNQFFHFQKKLDFGHVNIKKSDNPVQKTANIVQDFLKQIEDVEVRNILNEEFKKEFK
jgi:DNA repair exonuclease SbcCD nuclease subunit